MTNKTQPMHITLEAPAKVNLYLHITGQRADGYHLLDSVAAFTAFGDTLRFTLSETLSLTIEGEYGEGLVADDNLVLRAARALQSHTGCTLGASIALIKRIPVGAGLGGGSSDAAAALIGLNCLWDLRLSRAQLAALALPLGSDIPVCLAREPARMQGIGDEVLPVLLNPDVVASGVVLVNPRMSLLTASVYKAFAGALVSPVALPASIDMSFIAAQHNALEAPAKALLPVVGEMIATLAQTPDCRLARMSGSGATCFALYATSAQAQTAAQGLAQRYPHWWVQVTSWYHNA